VNEPIPAQLWAAIKTFLADERTGTISLNVNRGRVESIDLRERVKAECLPKPQQ